MVVKIAPGQRFEVVDGVRHLIVEWVEGGALLVSVKVEECEAAVAITTYEVRQLLTFLT